MDLSLNSFELILKPFFLAAAGSFFVLAVINLSFKAIFPLLYRGNVPKWILTMEQPFLRGTCLVVILTLAFVMVKTNPLSGTVLVLISIGGSWQYVRNFLSGAIILASNKLVVGNKIRTGDHEGTVDSLNWFDITLRKRNGEKVSIPYTHISERALTYKAPTETSVSHTIIIPISSLTDLLATEETIRKRLDVSPWILNGPPPTIERKVTNNGNMELLITIYGIEIMHLKQVEEEIRSHIQLKRA